jgi:hypothetical protein
LEQFLQLHWYFNWISFFNGFKLFNSFSLALVASYIPLGPTGPTLLPGQSKWLGWLAPELQLELPSLSWNSTCF